MKIIELTNYNNNEAIYINIDYIGDFLEVTDTLNGRKTNVYTRVGVLTHNNGGFRVKETPKEIMVKLSKINLLTIINR